MKPVIILLAATAGVTLLSACAPPVGTHEVTRVDTSILLDVRTKEEFDQGHLKRAINLPHTEIETRIADHVTNKQEKIIVYCRSGRRSRIAVNILKEMGYINVNNAGAYADLLEKEEEQRSEGVGDSAEPSE